MAKRRTKKQKLTSQKRRSLRAAADSVSKLANYVRSKSLEPSPKADKAEPKFQLTELLGYDSELIRDDLWRTTWVTGIVSGLLIGIWFYLW